MASSTIIPQVAIKHLTNSIRNGIKLPINTAMALESVANNLNGLNIAVSRMSSSSGPIPATDNSVSINGIPVTY